MVLPVRFLKLPQMSSMSLSILGTGKTESVKALGHALGRFVLVFNCDESFDFQVSDLLSTIASILISTCRLGHGTSLYWSLPSR